MSWKTMDDTWLMWPYGAMRGGMSPYDYERVWLNRDGWESPEVCDPLK